MTGWRLGWLVPPSGARRPGSKRLAQTCTSAPRRSPSTPRWPARTQSIAEYERRRGEFRRRRDYVVPALESLGLPVPVVPDRSAFAWADCSRHTASSWDFCFEMMRRAHVALTPGRDFGPAAADRYLRRPSPVRWKACR